jgi:hypothetical protein
MFPLLHADLVNGDNVGVLQTRRRSLATFFRWAVHVGHIVKAPTDSIDPIDEMRMPDLDEPPAILSVSQCRETLQAALRIDPGLVPYVAVGLFAGLRPDREAAKLTSGDISNGLIHVRGLHAEDRQARHVDVQPVLQAWLDLGGDLPPVNLRKRFELVREAAGLIRIERSGLGRQAKKKITPTGWAQDCMRQTFASHYLPIFGAEKTIAQLGHGDYLLPSKLSTHFWPL